MELIYQKFTRERLSPAGVLEAVDFDIPKDFNFGFDVVDALAKKCPEKTALLHLDRERRERRFSFAEISALSNRAANALAGLGIGKGDVVLLVLRRNWQFWPIIVALHKLGAVAVPATDQRQKKDFVYRFRAAKIKAVLCTAEGEAAGHIEAALPESPTVRVCGMVNGLRPGWTDFDALMAASSPDFSRPAHSNDRDDLMLMYFTSGTTGYPKIAAHTFSYPLGHVVTARYWHNVRPDGIHFAISDTGWGKAVWGKLYGQWLCETCVFVFDFDRFHPAEVLEVIQDYKIDTFCAPPTMYRFFIKEDLSRFDLSHLKYACIAGEALNPEVFRQFYESTGLKLMEGFGQTETTLTVCNLVGTEPKPGSMGKPNPPYEVDLLTGEGKSAQPGEVGEIVLRTDRKVPVGMFRCYYLDEEKTKEAWHDGLYHTGDMAWKDEDGYFWYVGRTDDLIKSSGYRIGPFEIESVLMEHPAVLECAVTAVPDPIRGQAVKATIVLARGFEPSETLKKELQDHVKKMTAPYKYPRVVEFVSELPKTVSGKIKRVDIRGGTK